MQQALFNNITVVLVRTFHPGNIGSAARAMKTMGLYNLVLVNPVDFPHEDATRMAAGAADVLKSAVVVDNLLDAVADCTVVAACSARERGYELPGLSPPACAKKLLSTASTGPAALVFGPERQGLSNADLKYATHRVGIDANPEYSSLNLAAAVQVLSYALRQESLEAQTKPQIVESCERPSVCTLEHYFEHLMATYTATGFVNKAHPGELENKLRHLYARAEVNQQELGILHGMLSSMDRFLPDK